MNFGENFDNRTINTLEKWVSPAKLNLGLRIVGRRKDGYHLLESLFWPVTLADNLSLANTNSNEVTTLWGDMLREEKRPLPSQPENIVYKLLQARTAARLPALRVSIEKNIPIGGGLGGGSSNVGTLLRHGLGVDEDVEAEALRYGADVPFFLDPRPSWVRGVGEDITRLKISPELQTQLAFLIVILPEPTLTAAVFREYKELGTKFTPRQDFDPSSVTSLINFASYLKTIGNDLEAPACRVTPRIDRCLSALRELPSLYAGLSGSGSTCFAVFSSPKEAQNSLKVLSQFLRTDDCKGIIAFTHSSQLEW